MISIIINNFNYGHFLAAAIESALAQTHPACEVIVVDDGSADNSAEVMRRYGERIVPIYKSNGGQASALNTGFARSRGALVIFLDADDQLLPEIGAQVWAAFQANPNAAKIQYRMRVIDSAGRPTGEVKPAPHLPLPSGDLRRQELNFPFDLTWMATSGNAFSAQVLRQIWPLPEADFPILADYYLAHLAPLCGEVLFLDEIGAEYRVHTANHYARQEAAINLEQLRKTIVYTHRTLRQISRLAHQLQLEHLRRGASSLSVADLGNRLISLTLDPTHHPLPDEKRWQLCGLGIAAAIRRFDITWQKKALFLVWFIGMLVAPWPLTRWLAEQFVFPAKPLRLPFLVRSAR